VKRVRTGARTGGAVTEGRSRAPGVWAGGAAAGAAPAWRAAPLPALRIGCHPSPGRSGFPDMIEPMARAHGLGGEVAAILGVDGRMERHAAANLGSGA